MKILTEWSTARPARVGWYIATIDHDPNCRRYWNGTRWSAPVYVGDPEEHADLARRRPADIGRGDRIEWRGLTFEAHQRRVAAAVAARTRAAVQQQREAAAAYQQWRAGARVAPR